MPIVVTDESIQLIWRNSSTYIFDSHGPYNSPPLAKRSCPSNRRHQIVSMDGIPWPRVISGVPLQFVLRILIFSQATNIADCTARVSHTLAFKLSDTLVRRDWAGRIRAERISSAQMVESSSCYRGLVTCHSVYAKFTEADSKRGF